MLLNLPNYERSLPIHFITKLQKAHSEIVLLPMNRQIPLENTNWFIYVITCVMLKSFYHRVQIDCTKMSYICIRKQKA